MKLFRPWRHGGNEAVLCEPWHEKRLGPEVGLKKSVLVEEGQAPGV